MCKGMDFGSGWTICSTLRPCVEHRRNLCRFMVAPTCWVCGAVGRRHSFCSKCSCRLEASRSHFFWQWSQTGLIFNRNSRNRCLETNECFHKACFGLWMGKFQTACRWSEKSGWTTQAVLCRYLHLVANVLAQQSIVVPDCAPAHIGKQILQVAKDCDLYLCYVPAGCTPYVQPVDVGCFSPSKAHGLMRRPPSPKEPPKRITPFWDP